MAENNEVWCVAEARKGKLVSSVYELLGAGRTLAEAMGGKLAAVVIGHKVGEIAAGLGAYGAQRVYAVDHPAFAEFTDETASRALAEVVKRDKPRLVLLAGSTTGRSLAARTAALAGIGLAAEVSELSYDKGSDTLKAVRSCGGGSWLTPVSWDGGKPGMATVRLGSFERAQSKNGQCEVVQEAVDPSGWNPRTRFKGFFPEESKEIDLARADIVVSGGYALGGPQAFDMLRELAHLLGGAVGASRRAVDSGWIPYRHQVGLTGRTVKPKVYIACGISGQIQHLAGMSQADTIVAINTDPKAPMMELANYSVVGDIFELVPALIEELKKQKQ